MAEFVPNIVESRDSALVSFLNAAELEKQLGLLSCSKWDWGTKWLALDCRGVIGALDSLSDAFLETYLAERGRDILEGLPFHWAALCLKHAKFSAAYHFERWQEKTTAMLEEGLLTLGPAH